MKISRSFSRVSRVSPVLISFGAALALAGCPGGADLEDPDRFVIPDQPGTGGTGMAGTGTGGGAGSATAGSGGSAGGGVPDIPNAPTCDWQTGLRSSCAISSCHAAPRGSVLPYALLNLVPDAGLVSRIKDVAPTLRDVDCDPGPVFTACVPPEPPACQPFAGTKLIDSADPMGSFLITKMAVSGCGNEMPLSPGNEPGRGWGEERKQCLIDLFIAIAEMP